MTPHDYDELQRALVPVAVTAGAAILRHYRNGVRAEYKDNWSPVTAADREAEAIILAGLARVLPGVPVVAEEEASEGRIPATGREFVLVDPLDGTREFVDRRDEFTVNIAVVRDGVPCFGIVYAPATAAMYVTASADRALEARIADPSSDMLVGEPVWRPIRAREPDPEGLTVLASRSHLDDATKRFIARFKVRETRNAGSSLKFCVLARGDADLYPRFGPTMEWDTAAGHAVLIAAGGSVTTTDGGPFLYGKSAQDYRNGGFLAWGARAL